MSSANTVARGIDQRHSCIRQALENLNRAGQRIHKDQYRELRRIERLDSLFHRQHFERRSNHFDLIARSPWSLPCDCPHTWLIAEFVVDLALFQFPQLGAEFIDDLIDRGIHFLGRRLRLQTPALHDTHHFSHMMKLFHAEQNLQGPELQSVAVQPFHACFDILP